MKIILFIFGVFCAASAFPHEGLRKDSLPQCHDPTFACQDLASARLCGVVKDCIHDIWSTMSVPRVNDEICDICKEMVKEARDQLLSNMTQEEIKEVFEGSCKLLPVKLVADACIKVVDEIIPELVEMLASRMDPTMVCTVSGMCLAGHPPIEEHIWKIVQIVLARNKESQCSYCTTMISSVKDFLKGASVDEVKTYIKKFCDEKMPSYLCNPLVNHYLPDIYQYLKDTPSNEVCSSVGICPKVCVDNEAKVNDELTCEFCEHVLEHIKELVTANTTLEEFKTALLNFCKHVGSFSDKCTSLVNDYYDMLFNYIKQLDSKGMCTLMGLCGNQECVPLVKLLPTQLTQPLIRLIPAQKMTTNENHVPLVKLIPAQEPKKKLPLIRLLPAQKITINENPLVKLIPSNSLSKKEMKESNDIFQPLIPLSKFTVFEPDTECALCKAFSFYLEKDLSGNRNEDAVHSAIGGICSKWMIEYPEHCKRISQKYSSKMQKAVKEGVKFEDICFNVKACSTRDEKTGFELDVRNIHKDAPFCDLCKDAMNQVEKQLSDPATKQMLKNLFDQGCNILPQSLRDDCTNFVNQNIDAVIDILEQELKPDNICNALGLCPKMLRISVPQRVKDLECNVCKDVVSSFKQKLEDPASKKIVLTMLEEACARLPASLAKECKTFVDEEIDTIMSIIIQEMDPNSVCSLLNICPAVTLKKETHNPIKDIECELCKQVVSKVEDLVKNKKTEDEIRAALDKVCSYMPSSIVSKCNKFVDEYTDLVIQLLLQELDPAAICAALNLCPTVTLKKETDISIKGMECELCKEVISKVEDLVKDKKTEDEIRAVLDKVCSYMPSSIVSKCDKFVQEYTDIVIELLLQELDPATICATLNLCPRALEKENDINVKDLECDLCKEVVKKLENLVKDKKSEDEIKKALDKVCSFLPSSVATKCENFVNQYTELLITVLAQELDPGMVCAAMKVCPTLTHLTEKQLIDYEKAKNIECQACQYVLHFLQNQLMDAAVQEEIKNELKKLCSVLPSDYQKNCEAFIDEYGASLLTLVAQEIDPSQVCWKFDICTNQESSTKSGQSELSHFLVDECSVCTTVVNYLDKLLEEDDVDKEITQVIEKVCGVVPSSFQNKCSTILETYGPYLLQMIGQLADSKQVCQDIDLCSRPHTSVHLIGGSKCTFGPSYWCTSKAHAAACKAEIFCESKGWKI